MDILVSLTVIAVLISLLLPSLSGVRELTRRVVCGSNARQQGLALAMFQEDSKGVFPESKFEAKQRPNDKGQLQNMMIARTSDTPAVWDGLGVLFQAEYLNAPQVFYCPSHTGEHPFAAYASLWPDEYAGQIVINYHYRGATGSTANQQPDRMSVITDGLRTKSDYNHKVGSNVLRADFSVKWFSDPTRSVTQGLPSEEGELAAADKVEGAWLTIDGIINIDVTSNP